MGSCSVDDQFFGLRRMYPRVAMGRPVLYNVFWQSRLRRQQNTMEPTSRYTGLSLCIISEICHIVLVMFGVEVGRIRYTKRWNNEELMHLPMQATTNATSAKSVE